MPRTGLWLRVFIGLLLAVLTPLILLVGALLLTESLLAEADPNLVAVLVVVGAIAWAAILAIVYARSLDDDFRALVSLAQRGDEGSPADTGAAYQQMATLLDERNRQLASLARQAAQVPIDDEPERVIRSLVTAIGSVIGDPTWRCAVLATDNAELLPPGIYHAIGDEHATEPIGDLERWASTAEPEAPARHVEGPWGAFTVVDVAVSDRMRAILYAPWQGRSAPTRSEIDLLTLVGQHAGTALEHSLLYAQVRSQADELNRLAAVQADFLRGVTHDLQTPLTSIGALATELGADPRLSSTAQSDLEMISHQADRLRRMVSQLLVASRLEAGVLTPAQEVFAVPPLIERTWAALRAVRPFDLEVAGTPHLAVADPDRLEQVLWAVLDNAVKYSPAGSAIGVRLEPMASGDLAVSVTDHGTGMDDATRQHAFEQFYRSGAARQLAPDGSGVGLYASHGLMRAMGGDIHIDSRLGEGTTITLRIPAEPSGGDSA
ncbi:MAG: sensor histidine kinase [Candidatus Limnocylindria bacterium]